MPELDVNPSTATDREWSLATGHCGGCGLDACHDGECLTAVCLVCPTREATGEAAYYRKWAGGDGQ